MKITLLNLVLTALSLFALVGCLETPKGNAPTVSNTTAPAQPEGLPEVIIKQENPAGIPLPPVGKAAVVSKSSAGINARRPFRNNPAPKQPSVTFRGFGSD